MLAHEVDVNAIDDRGYTALQLALSLKLYLNKKEILKTLLEVGANLHEIESGTFYRQVKLKQYFTIKPILESVQVDPEEKSMRLRRTMQRAIDTCD